MNFSSKNYKRVKKNPFIYKLKRCLTCYNRKPYLLEILNNNYSTDIRL